MRNCYPHKYLWVHAQSLQCPTLCDPMDCSPQGSSVHGVLQARILEWVAVPSSRDLPLPGSTSASKIFWGWHKPRRNFTYRRVFGLGELGDSTVVEYLDQVMLWLHSIKTTGKSPGPWTGCLSQSEGSSTRLKRPLFVFCRRKSQSQFCNWVNEDPYLLWEHRLGPLPVTGGQREAISRQRHILSGKQVLN